MLRSIKYHTVSAFLGSLLCVMFINVWSNLAPVNVLMEPDRWVRNHSYITAHVVGYQARDCRVVTGSFVGWVHKNGYWQEVPFSIIDTGQSYQSVMLPYWKQSFGVWEWQTRPRGGRLVKVTMQHMCGGVVKTTTIGPFEFEVGR